MTRTIDKIMQGVVVPAEIIVIDQTNDESERKKIKEIGRKIPSDVSYIYYYQSTPSATKARNNGIEIANYDILVFMDDDVDVKEDTILQINKFMSASEISMVACIDESLPSSDNFLGYFFGLKSWKKKNIGHVTLSMLGRYPSSIREKTLTEWAMGFCFSVKKSNLNRWNIRFDEKMSGYAYAEDLDFSYRYFLNSKEENMSCYLSNQLRVVHLESKEFRIPSANMTNRFVINRMYLSYKLHKGIDCRIAMVWSNFGHFLMRLFSSSSPFDILKAQRKAIMLQKRLKKGELKAEFYD